MPCKSGHQFCDRFDSATAGAERLPKISSVYDRPSSRFVAEFIGSSNIFVGIVIENGSARVLRCDRGLEVSINEVPGSTHRAQLLFRPEKIRVAETGDGLAVVVREVTLLGPTIEYVMEFSCGQTLWCESSVVRAYWCAASVPPRSLVGISSTQSFSRPDTDPGRSGAAGPHPPDGGKAGAIGYEPARPKGDQVREYLAER